MMWRDNTGVALLAILLCVAGAQEDVDLQQRIAAASAAVPQVAVENQKSSTTSPVTHECTRGTCHKKTQAFSFDVTETPVSDVIVYQYFAQVHRNIPMKTLLPGTYEITVNNMIGEMNDSSVRALIPAGVSATVQGVVSRTFDEGAQKKLTKFQEKEKNIQADIKDIQRQHKLLIEIDGRLSSWFGRDTLLGNENVTLEDLDSMVKEYERHRASFSTRMAALSSKQLQLETELQQVQAEIRRENALVVRKSGSMSVVIRINVYAEIKESWDLQLVYLLPGASWTALYDVSVNYDLGTLDVVYYAQVQQVTGEDWQDCQVQLSTADPASRANPPTLSAKRVKWTVNDYGTSNAVYHERTREEKRAIRRAAMQNMWQLEGHSFSSASMAFGDGQEDVAGSTPDIDVPPVAPTIQQWAPNDTTLRIPGVSTLLSSFEENRLVIGSFRLNATFERAAKPSASSKVYIRAATGCAPVPLLASNKVNIFIGDSFVAKSSIPYVSSGQAFGVYLGIDHDMQLTYAAPLSRHSKQSSFLFEGPENHVYAYKTTVRSAHKKPVKLQVIHPLPLSEDDQISVHVNFPTRWTKGAGDECTKGSKRCQCFTDGAEQKCFTAGAAVAEGTNHVQWFGLVEPESKEDFVLEYKLSWTASSEHKSGVTVYDVAETYSPY